jgi:hypothetical protein
MLSNSCIHNYFFAHSKSHIFIGAKSYLNHGLGNVFRLGIFANLSEWGLGWI